MYAFAKKHHWESRTRHPFVKRVEIYDTKEGFDNRIRSLRPDCANLKIPKSLSGRIEADIYLPGSKLTLSDKEIWEIVNAKQRGSYLKYNVVFKHFLKDKGCSLAEYVKRAGDEDFLSWLRKS